MDQFKNKIMIICKRIKIKGAVQGVGFRPFIYNLANSLQITGFISNTNSGVVIEVSGTEVLIDTFIQKINSSKPVQAIIRNIEITDLELKEYKGFEIRKSENTGSPKTIILPDLAVCDDCLEELFNPINRRYLYPFINCTNCGPRFSIVEKLPYDRPNTSMKIFAICDACKSEYNDPTNRRFHAQPIACDNCGPSISLWNNSGEIIAQKNNAINFTQELLANGKIIALKGLGGFQLLVNATIDKFVEQLRFRKHRDEKPFALMLENLEAIKQVCFVNDNESKLLTSSKAPVLLLKRNSTQSGFISDLVAPKNPYLGIMLPYTPLHHLLLEDLGFPIITTSGNISEEPMCIDEFEALERLNGIADYFLVHNRPIVRQVDDSVVRVIKDKEMIIRRARGYAPIPISVSADYDGELLAVGGELKNTIALKKDNNVFISQYIGDLKNIESETIFRKTISDFSSMYNSDYQSISHDLHPLYLSTKYARETGKGLHGIQHHLAHVAGCYEENNLNEQCLAVCWDGTGLGTDDTIWGGEFFTYDKNSYKHIGQFRQFKIPGGDKAIKHPDYSLIAILYEIYKSNIPSGLGAIENWNLLTDLISKNINCFNTSSVGRIFDAVASLTNICQYSSYEGQAAMMVEFSAAENIQSSYSFNIVDNKIKMVDWEPVFRNIISDIQNDIKKSIICSKFINTISEVILEIATQSKMQSVILTGGCFQNVYLLEKSIDILSKNGFKAYWNHKTPPNDGGISFGQIAFTLHHLIDDKKAKLLQNELLKD